MANLAEIGLELRATDRSLGDGQRLHVGISK